MPCPVVHAAQPEFVPSDSVYLKRFPEETLLLGSAKAYVRNGLEFYRRCERIAGIVQTRFLWKQAYIITEPSAIGDVLVNHHSAFIKPYVLRRLKVLFGDGLLTSDGDIWKRHRRMVQPAFSSDRMTGFIDVVCKNAEAMAASWCDGEVRDVYPDLIDLCMKNVVQTMFGESDEELGNIVRELAAMSHRLVHAVFDVIRPLPFRFPRQLRRQVEKHLDALNRYLGRLIDQRAAEPPRDDFLGLLLSGTDSYPPLSRQEILDESVTLLLAGHETTASALVWSLYLLARHPQEAKALAEDLAPDLHDEVPLYDELDSLPSLRAALDESLRLYPPTHRIARTITTPVLIGGHILPAGADVILPQWAVHRSPRWYDEPESYLPSRWTTAFRKALPKFAYFPFSGGARICVGAQLAWCESAVILALLVQRFRFSLVDAAPLVPYEGLTMLPASGELRVRLDRRKRAYASPNLKHWSSAIVG